MKLTFILKSDEIFLRHSIHVSDKHVFSSSKWFLVNLKTFGSRIFSPKMLLNNSKNNCDSNISENSGKLLNTVFTWCFQKYLNQRKGLKLFHRSKFWQENCNFQNVPQVTWTRYRYHKRTQKPDNKVLLRLFRFFVPGLFFSLSKAVFGLSEISGIKMFWFKNFLNNSKINCDTNFFFSF